MAVDLEEFKVELFEDFWDKAFFLCFYIVLYEPGPGPWDLNLSIVWSLDELAKKPLPFFDSILFMDEAAL